MKKIIKNHGKKTLLKKIIPTLILITLLLLPVHSCDGEPKDRVSGDTLTGGDTMYVDCIHAANPDLARNLAGGIQQGLNEPGFINQVANRDGELVNIDPDTEYKVTPVWARDDSGNWYASHYKISGVEQEPDLPHIPHDFEPHHFEPTPTTWRCYTTDGKDRPRRQWNNGWIGSTQSCGTSSTGSPQDWTCRGPDGTTAIIKERLRVNTERGCNNGSCYTTTTTQVYDEFNCPYGCIQGNCLPNPVIKSNPAHSSSLEAGTADTIELDCTDSDDPDGTIEKCEWSLGDGTTTTEEKITHSYENEGSYNITLTVTDDKGATNTKTIHANIYKSNESPIPCFKTTPLTGIVGKTEFSFDASCAYDPDGEIISFEWNLGDGTINTGEKITHIYTDQIPNQQQYKITLTVTDNEGAKASKDQNILIYNTPPEAKYTAVPLYGIHPLTVVFTNNSTDPDTHKITQYSWDITGDGEEDYNTEHVIHTYNTHGTYNTILTISNEYGAISQPQHITIKVYQLNAIKTLQTQSINQGQNITIHTQCAGEPQINYTIKKGTETIATYTNQNCGLLTHGPIKEPGLYEITATIPGCTTIECRKTATFNVFEEMPEETPVPETHALIALLTGIAVLGIAGMRSKTR